VPDQRVTEQPLEDLLARLDRERREADRLYNDALTAVDRAIQLSPALPAPPKPFDPSRLPDVNAAWDILPVGAPPIDRSLKGRLRGFVWRLIGPPLETQKRFNAALVDHLNRNTASAQESSRTVSALLDTVRREFDALVRFESTLVQYLQSITLYVDSKDRSLGARELGHRFSLAEQRLLALKRDVEDLIAARSGAPATAAAASESQRSGASASATYVGFEDRFRGTSTEISNRVREYVPLLSSSSDVVDIGCGRGELLTLLKERGVAARGVDANAAMVEVCRARGLNVEQGDALEYLSRQKDGSIGGLSAVQVVEHFEPPYLGRFLETAYHKMRSGAPIVLETINPACWMAFFETYIRDLTHARPLHPDTLSYLVQAAGFSKVDVQFRQPVPEGDRLERISVATGDPDLASIAATLNAHADKLNARLFSSMDYVVIARR
jgi:2-polyprenyl-3-methyl-5-hydroxy-6-metoxy-1,4-benzoquinol methylase